MLESRVIPCLLLKNRGLYKTITFKDARYVGDPINVMKIFNDKEVDELIILDISKTISNLPPDFDFILQIVSECFMPVCYGGGITCVQDAKKLFNIGVEKISINTKAIENPELVKDISEICGSQSVVVSIDAKKQLVGGYEVCTHGGRKRTGLDPKKISADMEEMGAGEILINSISRDGTMSGYDIQLIKEITNSVNIPVIACGGAGRIEDFANAVIEGRASAVSAGSFFLFHGKYKAVLVNYPKRKVLTNLF